MVLLIAVAWWLCALWYWRSSYLRLKRTVRGGEGSPSHSPRFRRFGADALALCLARHREQESHRPSRSPPQCPHSPEAFLAWYLAASFRLWSGW